MESNNNQDRKVMDVQQDLFVTETNDESEGDVRLPGSQMAKESSSSILCELSFFPEEILERILSFLSPYKDLDTIKLVSRQWHRLTKSVARQTLRAFHQQMMSCNVRWTQVVQEVAETDPPYPCIRSFSISDRFSHSAAYVDGSMYVFGGCSSTSTTFNDLWRLDLSNRQWMRPVAMGSYPSPKACASMVVYQGKLILFGGWSHPIPYPLHQSAHYFSELHQYDPSSNRWSLFLSLGPEPDALGGHSASVVGDLMVVFGGSTRPGHGSNKVWVYNFSKCCWSNPQVTGRVQPEPRYGQYQCTLDDSHILIMGGCVGHNKVFNDFYVLNLHSTEPWFWTKLDVVHPELAAQQTWCHAACKVNDMIAVVAKSAKPREAKNVPPHVMRVLCGRRVTNNSSSSSKRLKSGSQPQQHHFHPQSQSQQLHHQTPSLSRETDHGDSGIRPRQEETQEDAAAQPQSINRSLLALQQRLHRDCVSLPDRDNHHHNAQANDDAIADSHIERLQNRVQHQLPPQHHHHALNQPHAGQFHRPDGVPARQPIPMPSIRPNANSNRQRQLEALQRQEELLRSKSRALAAARNKNAVGQSSSAGASALCSSVDDQEIIPATVMTKNRMDVHVVDISKALTEGLVEWKPESPLQPPGAPTETICSSLVEGRGELVLFGGVSREMSSPMMTNVAVNKLYFLH